MSLRDHHWAHTSVIALGMLVAWSLLLWGLLELTFAFPVLSPVVGVVLAAVVIGLVVNRMPFFVWVGSITARWRRCDPA